MQVLEWFSAAWPVVIVLIGFAFRMENGQALNRQALIAIQKSMEDAKIDHDKDIKTLTDRIERHEQATQGVLKEIQGDIKTLLRQIAQFGGPT
tara:strand:+ start:115 stop:393 length:279 start_codon:yes stop_codon:yes gene_type:complete